MSTPHESQSADAVGHEAFLSISRVLTDRETEVLAAAAFKAYEEHKKKKQELSNAVEERVLGEGRVASAQRGSDMELHYFSQRTAAGYARFPKKGESSPEYRFLFNDRTIARLLPPGTDERLDELDQLLLRVNDQKQAGVLAKTLLGALPASLEGEKEAVAECKRLMREEDAAGRAELNARRRLVAAVRSMTKDVQSLFSDSPATARRVLGHRNPVVARRRNARLAAAVALRTSTEPVAPVLPGPVAAGSFAQPESPRTGSTGGETLQLNSATPVQVQLNGSAPVPVLPAAVKREDV